MPGDEDTDMARTAEEVPDTVVHRALSSPTRSRVLHLLRSAEAPMSAQELATALDLHPNTVRSHLGILQNARLVASSRQGSGRRGRPRHLFEAVDEDGDGTGSDEAYQLLATVLADRVRGDHPDAEHVVEQAAVAWSHRLIEPGEEPANAAATADRLSDLLRLLGFVTRLDGDVGAGAELIVESCPFAEVARTHPEVACSFHRGLIQGVLTALGGHLRLLHLEADPRTHRCRAAVRSAG